MIIADVCPNNFLPRFQVFTLFTSAQLALSGAQSSALGQGLPLSVPLCFKVSAKEEPETHKMVKF